MKSKRQEKILELIEKYNIETQEELIARLAECGIESKQTTVSRDIKELYLYKEPIGGGRSRYAVSGKADHIDNTKRLKLILNECSVGVDYAGIVVLLKTLPGLADAAGADLHIAALIAAQGVQQAVFYHGLQHQAEYLGVHHIVVHFIINNKAVPKAVVLHFHIFFKVVQLFPQADALLRVGQRIL